MCMKSLENRVYTKVEGFRLFQRTSDQFQVSTSLSSLLPVALGPGLLDSSDTRIYVHKDICKYPYK